ncbi:MAG: ExbD/TolR family protein [Bacteroidales bacterium]|jgi:biopolymer transport protein ExbD
MAIKTRNKVSAEMNMSSMADLVFLLLIFFMISSTLVSPNAIKLLLPSSSSKTMAKQTTTVYINDTYDFYVNETPADPSGNMVNLLIESLAGETEGVVVLRADKTVPVQYVVNVIDVVNQINQLQGTKHKVILATQPIDQ